MVKESANYLIEVDGKLYGYWDALILKINISEIKPTSYRLFKKSNNNVILEYEPIELEQLSSDLADEHIESEADRILDHGDHPTQ